MADDDLMYLLQRAADEKRLAVEAANDEARLAHVSLASAYEQKARDADPAPLTATRMDPTVK